MADTASLNFFRNARPEWVNNPWGCSSAGRAPALQAGGHGFESHHLHQPQVAAPKKEKVDGSTPFSKSGIESEHNDIGS